MSDTPKAQLDWLRREGHKEAYAGAEHGGFDRRPAESLDALDTPKAQLEAPATGRLAVTVFISRPPRAWQSRCSYRPARKPRTQWRDGSPRSAPVVVASADG